jgi:hypothetical protein
MLTTDWSVVIIVLVIALGSWIIYGGEIIGGALVISWLRPVRPALPQRQVGTTNVPS